MPTAIWLDDIKAFWQSPEGQKIKAAEQADEAELQAWLAEQPGVLVHTHGGLCPEEWSGDVDGHSFHFHERWDQWRIQLDLRHERELDESEVIAYGTTDIEGYGTTPVERAQFIVDTIRIHLTRQERVHHHGNLSSIETHTWHRGPLVPILRNPPDAAFRWDTDSIFAPTSMSHRASRIHHRRDGTVLMTTVTISANPLLPELAEIVTETRDRGAIWHTRTAGHIGHRLAAMHQPPT